MDHDDILSSLSKLQIPQTHASVGLSNLIASNKQYRSLFVNRRLPDTGWSDVQIQHLLFTLSTLDTNNEDPIRGGGSSGVGRWTGVGEREGRVYSPLVSSRHFGLSHGIGRSGDITEPQPKAAGSSALAKLALCLALDAMRRGSGLDSRTAASHGILLPLCTGMSMSLVLSSLRDGLSSEEERSKRNIVLWSRIDQKSCYKAILSAGMTCVVVPTKLDPENPDEVVTDLDAMKSALKENEGRVLAVITTTSCFAPRVPDQVDEVGKICMKEGVSHVINNAYGLQCKKTCKLINRACTLGRVDAIVCSTDKNFLVPVGGAIVISPKEEVIRNVGKVYPGRASASPIIDLFITLLSMGMEGYSGLLSQRNSLLPTFEQKFGEIAKKHGERILCCPRNTISFGITLDTLTRGGGDLSEDEAFKKKVSKEITYFGSMLFTRCVSGTRVVPRGQAKKMGNHDFIGFGSSTENYGNAYLTAACAIGLREDEADEFFARLDKAFKDFSAKRKKDDAKKKKAEDIQKM